MPSAPRLLRKLPPAIGAVVLAASSLGSGRAGAQLSPNPRPCAVDLAPAATLLLPYFEVDLVNAGGLTTLATIVNAEGAGRLVSVTLWTDLGVPTLHFHVYLTGYDVQSINLRDVFAGVLPATADQARDGADAISPGGAFSSEATFAGCAGHLPPPALSAELRASLAAAHTGGLAPHVGGCAAQAFADGVARGYVTFDVVNGCTLRVPGDPGYFVAGGGGDASNANVLWGDVLFVDRAANAAEGEPLVRVQAFPGRFANGAATFYGPLLGFSAADDREPLATAWAARFVQGGGFSGGTDLIVWRGPRERTNAFACGAGPAWYPHGSSLVVFDEQENPELAGHCGVATCPPLSTPVPFPAATNRVSIAKTPLTPDWGPPLPTSYDFGWLHARLSSFASPGAQGWIGQRMRASGRFSVGMRATPLDTACAPLPPSF